MTDKLKKSNIVTRNKMHCFYTVALFFISGFLFQSHARQANRIPHNGQDLFVSGTNVAWINFARDIGPGTTNLDQFEQMFRDLRANGGNSMRLWLHTSGSSTPEWNGSMVVGPGVGAVDDLRDILDLAYDNDISLMLCLWSFDMLRISNGATVTDRNYAILTQSANRTSYMQNALKPMVEALRGHPAILAWEIFNEAEGMSNEFGWDGNRKVPMLNIQQFVNQAAGTIKRADPDVLVTTGAWSFKALSDVLVAGSNATTDQNYYRDDRLKGFGGDQDGILDFYTVHYYDWAGTSLSPFHNDVSVWQLTKPVVVAEFYIKGNVFGVNKDNLFQTLRNRGYAGALSWQWVDWAQNRDNNTASWPNTLINTRSMWANYPADVDLSYGGLKAEIISSSTIIETNGEAQISWSVRGAVELTLNGNPVFFVDTTTVSPTETTTYILKAIDREGSFIERSVEIRVVAPNELNRSIGKETTSSTGEPEFATDEDVLTAWTSAGGQHEFIYVDLDGSFDVNELILRWGDVKPSSFTIAYSHDAVVWNDAYEQQGTYPDEQVIDFNEPLYGRFFRLSTANAAQLTEFEIYGIRSTVQRFKLDVTSPVNGEAVEAEAILTIRADLVRRAGPPTPVRFYANDVLLGSDGSTPYTHNWFPQEAGIYIIRAEVTDAGIIINSRPVTLTILPSVQKRRYEAESATLSGSLTIAPSTIASGGNYVVMENDGEINWNNITVLTTGEFTLRFGYNLPFDYKAQDLSVNSGQTNFFPFTPPTQTWSIRDTVVTLEAGNNSVKITKNWGYMWFDYLEVRGDNQYITSLDDDMTHPSGYVLAQNYPNPFNPSTIIGYTLPVSGQVQLAIYDVTGRHIKTLVDSMQLAGTYETSFNATGLSSGLYLYILRAPGAQMTGKMMLIK